MRAALAFLLSAGFAASAAQTTAAQTVQGQTIEMETLGEARAFAPGIDVPGGLSADGWIATRPGRAVRLMESLRTDTRHPVVRDMMRRVVLSGVAPPNGAGEDFALARIRAAQALATPTEYERFAARNPVAMDPRLRAGAALERGDLMAACAVSDAIVTGRGESDWVRLRAACHEARDETAAAELARDILRSRGEATVLDMGDPVDPFWAEAWSLDQSGLETFMAELAREKVGDDLLAGEAPDLGSDPLAVPAGAGYDINDALADPSAQGTARLFGLGRAGDAKAVAAFVERAVEAGFDPSATLSRIPALLDPAEMATVDLPLFARHAVATDDLGMIRALFEVADNPVLQQRLALAADALGGGFIAQPLGEGLEEGLASGGPTAVSDVLIALALGAELSESAEAALQDTELGGAAASADWIAIDQAIGRGARAEALLRLAAQVPPAGAATTDGWTVYRTIRGLTEAGFSDVARQLAAYEYLRGL